MVVTCGSPNPLPRTTLCATLNNPFGGGNAMVPHMSGTSFDAQKRYADGVKKIIAELPESGKHDYRPRT
jgi:formate dehydrogenase